jgi:hypothetical protein
MALPSDVVYDRTVRDTALDIDQARPLLISDHIYMNNPNRNKALSYILSAGVKESVNVPSFGHLEDAPLPNWVNFAGATETSQGTTGLVITEGSQRLGIGSRVFFPDTDQIIRFDAEFSGATSGAVTRNYGKGATTAYLTTGSKGLLLPPSHYEGFTVGAGQTNTKVYKSFNIEIVSWPLNVTDTEYASKARGGNPFARALNKAWDASGDQLESGLLFGAKYNANTGPNLQDATTPLRASEGLLNFCQTNVYAFTDLPTRQDLWAILGEWTMFNRDGGALLCSKAFKHWIANMAYAKLTVNEIDKAIGFSVDRIMTPDGQFDLVEVDLLNQHPKLMGMVFGIPARGSQNIKYRPLIGDMDLDIRYRPVVQDEKHQIMGEIYGQYGWEFAEEEKFLVIKGLRF